MFLFLLIVIKLINWIFIIIILVFILLYHIFNEFISKLEIFFIIKFYDALKNTDWGQLLEIIYNLYIYIYIHIFFTISSEFFSSPSSFFRFLNTFKRIENHLFHCSAYKWTQSIRLVVILNKSCSELPKQYIFRIPNLLRFNPPTN